MSLPLYLSQALSQAIQSARVRVGDPLAGVGVISTSRTTGEQLMRTLISEGGFFNVEFLTPSQIISALGRPILVAQGLSSEPVGWMAALLSDALPDLADSGMLGRYGAVLQLPGWRGPLISAIHELEAAGVSPQALRTIGQGSEIGERYTLLSALMEAVDSRRQQERLFATRQLEQAAAEQVRLPDHPLAYLRAAVVVGDSILSPLTNLTLSRLLTGMDTTRLLLHPLESLPPAPTGLRLSAQQARPLNVTPQPTALGHLQKHLGEVRVTAPDDDTVVLASTPDDVREVEEAVRIVRRAIRNGTPLDRIAIVLPDTTQVPVLEQALEQAGLEAAWLTAGPLSLSLPARFLSLSLQLALGDDTPTRWYQFLTHPGLVGMDPTGKRRWRSLLADAPSQTRGILRHLERVQEGEDEWASEVAAALHRNISELHERLQSLRTTCPLGHHGQAWVAFLNHYQRPERALSRVITAVEAWGDGEHGASVPLPMAATLLNEHLQSTPHLRGSLTQRVIRILPPMLALGGEYDLICVTGMTEGRFPRPFRDGGVLTEEMRAVLRKHGIPLVSQAEREAVEMRRLASVIAGCRGRLWLAAARTEQLTARPTLPGTLLLHVASVLAGRRLGFSALKEAMVVAGWRSHPVPSPVDAISKAEHLTARAFAEPESTMSVLAGHAIARRLMSLHREIDRVLFEGGLPGAWTGVIDSALLPVGALSGEPVSPRSLARMVHDPSGFFFHELLAAWPSRRLSRHSGLSARSIQRRVLEVLSTLEDASDVRAAFSAAWRAQLSTWTAEYPDLNEVDRTVLFDRGMRLFAVLARADATHGHTRDIPTGPLDPSLPVQMEVGEVLISAGSLMERGLWAGSAIKPNNQKGLSILLAGLAAANAGLAIRDVRRVGLDGRQYTAPLERSRADVRQQVVQASHRAEVGWWPITREDDRFALHRERQQAKQLDQGLVLARLEASR